jgi:predicted AAA+ superfamily ATPase
MGKTISNETFVVDLAKMPHLMMAGATGQGKSVGLNAVLTHCYTRNTLLKLNLFWSILKKWADSFNKIRHSL